MSLASLFHYLLLNMFGMLVHPSCSTATTRLWRAQNNINTKHNKYNRCATTNQIILSLVTEVKKKKYIYIYLPEDGKRLTETCWRILRLLKQYDHFNVLF